MTVHLPSKSKLASYSRNNIDHLNKLIGLGMTIMVTGGAGYIGSHTCVELMRAGHSVVVFDNFCNSQVEAVKRIERILRHRSNSGSGGHP